MYHFPTQRLYNILDASYMFVVTWNNWIYLRMIVSFILLNSQENKNFEAIGTLLNPAMVDQFLVGS